MTTRDSVFLRVLGDQARGLHPQLRDYVAGPPPGFRTGEGRGVFEIAGSPYRRLAGLLRLVAGADAVLSADERDVPFTIINRPVADAGTMALEAVRTFFFRRGRQRFADVLEVGRIPGTLVNTPGGTGRIEVLLTCSVTSEGHLRLRSTATRLRVGGRTLRLPRLFGVDVESIDGWDETHQRQTISVHARNPLLGTVLRYRGWFTAAYRV
ncbi:DUF4166 domain-containing protein [Citricoccus sp. NR2]|uniref:DUF4166 domain-containing protein n=1 Tax=Citricoccus sp. NR2 TaxID=3004095 RepID=UPI0022DD1E1B|nr:DUF4166 domain-containing protein [Citricoccus sp. NR2]WBL19559.1 DUF4166 domain-containing protein [Citricoccus sp. NR2]